MKSLGGGHNAVRKLSAVPAAGRTVYAEEAILDLPRLYINAGKRGLLVELSPGDLSKALESLTPVSVSRDP